MVEHWRGSVGLGASFGPFFGRPVLICLIYAVKDELIDQFLPRFHNSDICFREKMHHEEGICRDKRIKCKRKDVVLIKNIIILPNYNSQILPGKSWNQDLA